MSATISVARPPAAAAILGYRLEMLSDWHAGSGNGRPRDVDRLIARDADDLPYVPAKTVTGLWRDGCEIVARALDETEDGSWSVFTDRLFGSQAAVGISRRSRAATSAPQGAGLPAAPLPAALSIRAARLSAGLRAALRAADPAVRQAVTFVKPGVAIDPRTGRAVDRMLRFEEQARGGVDLTGILTLDPEGTFDEDARRYATALLLAGACLVEQIGAKRRRGNGRCRLSVDGLTTADWWTWLETAPPPSPASPRAGAASPRARAFARIGATEATWEVAQVRLTLVDPMLAAGRLVGNQLFGADHIPGTALIPHVLRSLSTAARRAGHDGDAPRRALLAGDLVVTDATVELAGQRALPAPRTVLRQKAATGPAFPVVNRTREPVDRSLGQLARLRDLYAAPVLDDDGRLLVLGRPEQEIHTHNSVDDTTQRPTRETGGGLYINRALRAGTVLRAEVRVRAGLLAAGWAEGLAGGWTAGQSKKDGYGRIEVGLVTSGPAPAPTVIPAGRRLAVWLLSDLVLLDERLRPSPRPDLLRAALAAALGLAEQEAAQGRELLVPVDVEKLPTVPGAVHEGGDDGLLRSMLATGRVESWHARWGLPRPTLAAFAAGSVAGFDLDATVSLDVARLADLAQAGLGERRAEGFGQIAVAILPDHPGEESLPGPGRLLTELGQATARKESPAGQGPAARAQLTARDERTLTLLRAEARRAEIIRRAVALAANPKEHRTALGADIAQVSPSQLALLHDILPLLTQPDSTTDLGGLIARVVDPKRRRGWPGSVGKAVRDLLVDDPDRVWTLLGWPAGLDDDPALRRELRAEAITTLVHTLLTARRKGIR
ncbi:conserved hypothetical protein [Frankia canadensis]|uniref:CRISPR type III-associated protein domain-containing protein n=1 Tax=Frankia canadensis TaxID=1836972 RepID=A0A2I2L2F6_9ACTN|nr:RAMP superfamily CRISPR-associated protein [Frankia canadensis]SNQ52099.1 conserved hypothetical protein [Frankia canadensis]SOU59389.1 conserved hypothetical protein [Frankia canadensis]